MSDDFDGLVYLICGRATRARRKDRAMQVGECDDCGEPIAWRKTLDPAPDKRLCLDCGSEIRFDEGTSPVKEMLEEIAAEWRRQ